MVCRPVAMTVSLIDGGQVEVEEQQSLVSRHSQRAPRGSGQKRNVLATLAWFLVPARSQTCVQRPSSSWAEGRGLGRGGRPSGLHGHPDETAPEAGAWVGLGEMKPRAWMVWI